MVSLKLVRSSNTELVKAQPLVAVVAGGTSGIGEHTIRALAATHGDIGKGLRIYIVGRNEASGKRVISECLKVCPKGDFRFIRANDLSLLKDVDRVCTEIIQAEKEVCGAGEIPRVDLLVMTHAYLAFEERQETKEGLDTLMSLLYYSRARFTMQLLPLLLASPLPARVISVFGPGRDVKIIPDDLSLRNPKNYGFMNMGSHAAYMMTFFMEKMATKHPERLSLTHYYPSLVITDGFQDERLPKWFSWLWLFLEPFVRPFTVPQMESGERVLFHTSSRFPARSASGTGEPLKSGEDIGIAVSSDGMTAGGAYRGNWNGETVPIGKPYKKLREEDFSERIWNHTMKAFEEIEAGNVFTE